MKFGALRRAGYCVRSVGVLLSLVLLLTAVQIGFGASTSGYSRRAPPGDVSGEALTYFRKGELYQAKNKYNLAEQHYRYAIRLDAGFAEAYSNLGYCLRKQNSPHEAIKQYRKAISLDDDLAEAHEYLGETYAEMGRYSEAEQEVRILRSIAPRLAVELEAFIREQKRK